MGKERYDCRSLEAVFSYVLQVVFREKNLSQMLTELASPPSEKPLFVIRVMANLNVERHQNQLVLIKSREMNNRFFLYNFKFSIPFSFFLYGRQLLFPSLSVK